MNSARAYKLAVGVLFPAFIVAVIVLVIVFRQSLWAFFTSPEDVQEWVSGYGILAPLVFVAAQVFQVVIFIVPGEVTQIAAGYLFGSVLGTVYSLLGILIGSAIDFWLARLLGRTFVEGLFGTDKVAQFDRFSESRGPQTAFFLLFVIPGIPKDILVYVAGISSMRFWSFLLVSMAGRLPGILGSAVVGNSAAQQRWVLGGVIFGIALILFVLGVLFRRRLQRLVTKLTGGGDDSSVLTESERQPD